MSGRFCGKLIVSDLDGTLLDSQRNVSQENQNAIRYFQAEGGLFTAATGRALRLARFIDHIPNAPCIYYNGALIYDLNTQTQISDTPLQGDIPALVCELMAAYPKLSVEGWSASGYYLFQSNDYNRRRITRIIGPCVVSSAETFDKPCLHINLVSEEPDITSLLRQLTDQYGNRFAVQSMPHQVGFYDKTVDKHTAITMLAGILGISYQNIYVVGDGSNDLGMLQGAAHRFAPANADLEIRQIADALLPSNDEHCIAALVELLK